MKRYQFIVIVILGIITSCKLKDLNTFRPVVISNIKYIDSLNGACGDFFNNHNKWVLEGIDSISLLNKTVEMDSTFKGSGISNFSLFYETKFSTIKGKKYINYEVDLKPVHSDIYVKKKYKVFGMKSNHLNEIDSFYIFKSNYKRGFNTYFNVNFISNLLPWQFYIKTPCPQNNAISFSLNNLTFQKNKFSKEQKEYFSRIINNSFVKYVEKNNMRVKPLQKFRNQFFLNFYNNKKRLINVKTDYSVDLNFNESLNKDSIYVDFKYYSKKNKEMNILIPEILKTRYVFNKNHFDLGNHVDVNLTINYIISVFIGNHSFIRYGEF
ncbi:hypothetical protein [Pedobacter alpinus]|uniref:Lipoprotein n=1 Tax=Pedobacter alpinus TaxID=1590643 RepID=A0ABW5TPH0_9SPHI